MVCLLLTVVFRHHGNMCSRGCAAKTKARLWFRCWKRTNSSLTSGSSPETHCMTQWMPLSVWWTITQDIPPSRGAWLSPRATPGRLSVHINPWAPPIYATAVPVAGFQLCLPLIVQALLMSVQYLLMWSYSSLIGFKPITSIRSHSLARSLLWYNSDLAKEWLQVYLFLRGGQARLHLVRIRYT